MNQLNIFGMGYTVWDTYLRVEKYPHLDEKVTALETTQALGGPVPAALGFLSRSGLSVSLMTAIGKDLTGDIILKTLQSRQINTKYIQISKTYPSVSAHVIVDANFGKRTVILNDSQAQLSENKSFIEAMSEGDILLLDGRYIPVSFSLAKAAKDKGVITVLDPGTRPLDLEQWTQVIHHFIAPKSFIMNQFGEIDLFQALQKLKINSVTSAVITLGAGGSMYLHNDIPVFQKVFKVESEDTTGAGDIFHAGYIYALSRNVSIEQRMEFASAAAAYSTLFKGTDFEELNAQSVLSHFNLTL